MDAQGKMRNMNYASGFGPGYLLEELLDQLQALPLMGALLRPQGRMLALLCLLVCAAARFVLFEKAGQPGISALIPLVNGYVEYRMAGMGKHYIRMLVTAVVLAVLPVAALLLLGNASGEWILALGWFYLAAVVCLGCIAFVVDMVASYRLVRRFGKGVLMFLVYHFLPAVGLLILAFGPAQYHEEIVRHGRVLRVPAPPATAKERRRNTMVLLGLGFLAVGVLPGAMNGQASMEEIAGVMDEIALLLYQAGFFRSALRQGGVPLGLYVTVSALYGVLRTGVLGAALASDDGKRRARLAMINAGASLAVAAGVFWAANAATRFAYIGAHLCLYIPYAADAAVSCVLAAACVRGDARLRTLLRRVAPVLAVISVVLPCVLSLYRVEFGVAMFIYPTGYGVGDIPRRVLSGLCSRLDWTRGPAMALWPMEHVFLYLMLALGLSGRFEERERADMDAYRKELEAYRAACGGEPAPGRAQ